MDHRRTLFDLVLALPDRQRLTLASILMSDWRAPAQGWVAIFSYCDDVVSQGSPHEGIGLTAVERVPDTTHPLAVGDPPGASIEAQIRMLGDARVVGGLDAARYEGAPRGTLEYVVKCRAGSDQERQDWLAELRTLPAP